MFPITYLNNDNHELHYFSRTLSWNVIALENYRINQEFVLIRRIHGLFFDRPIPISNQ